MTNDQKYNLLELVSKDIYLHYFDRELLDTFNIYNVIDFKSIVNDTIILMMSTYETMFCSLSLAFENKYLNFLCINYPDLVSSGQLDFSIAANSLLDFINYKREQYPSYIISNDINYQCYYDDTWKKMNDIGLSLRYKSQDTTEYLEKNIINELQDTAKKNNNLNINKNIDFKEITRFNPFIIDTIRNRKKLAITRNLYQQLFNTKSILIELQKLYAIQINKNYIQSFY